MIKRFFTLITYSYLLRFSLITILFLVLFPYIALRTNVASLFENMFDLSASGIALVTFNTMLASWSVMVTTRLVIIYSPKRFNVAETNIKTVMGWKTIFAFGLISVPMIAGIYWKIYDNSNYSPGSTIKYLAPLSGIIASFIFLFIADWVHRKVDNPATNKFSPDILFPTSGKLHIGKIGKKNNATPPQTGRPSKLGAWMRRLPEYIAAGYIDYDADPRDRVPLLAGHGLAIGLMITFTIVYGVVGVIASPWVKRYDVPALAYVLLLVTMLNWIIGGAAFFFDRFRVPMLAIIVLYLVTASALFPGTDNYYYAHPVTNKDPEYAVRALPQLALAPRERGKLILVAANGGGVQSAAWTARVLTGLEQQCRIWADKEPHENFDRRSFGNSLKLISAVSGGSVGAMYFINAYDGNGGGLPEDDRKLEDIVTAAQRSSLHSVSWGLVYPDFIRSIVPFISELSFFKQNDRGRALELAWQDTVPPDVTLSKWSDDVKKGKRPAVIFNTTISDTGEPMLFSTIDLSVTQSMVKNFEKEYKGYDVPVTTAVRLSATFPYVTPAARIFFTDGSGNSDPEYHIVDGGYYDNYGIANLVDLLDKTLLRSWGGEISDVLIIRIHGASLSGSDTPPDDSRGWLYQSFVPIFTLNTVRGTGQKNHSNMELELLTRAWEFTGNGSGVRIETATFEFVGTPSQGDPPLSWHLSEKQKLAINNEWKQIVNVIDPNLKKVKRFLEK